MTDYSWSSHKALTTMTAFPTAWPVFASASSSLAFWQLSAQLYMPI
jgi:hypothetical protein